MIDDCRKTVSPFESLPPRSASTIRSLPVPQNETVWCDLQSIASRMPDVRSGSSSQLDSFQYGASYVPIENDIQLFDSFLV